MAPTILEMNGHLVMVLTKEPPHKAPHVHVKKDGAECKIRLSDCRCYYNRGFSEKTVGRLEEYVEENKEILEAAWSDYHG